jgi:hypothetical protein
VLIWCCLSSHLFEQIPQFLLQLLFAQPWLQIRRQDAGLSPTDCEFELAKRHSQSSDNVAITVRQHAADTASAAAAASSSTTTANQLPGTSQSISTPAQRHVHRRLGQSINLIGILIALIIAVILIIIFYGFICRQANVIKCSRVEMLKLRQ